MNKEIFSDFPRALAALTERLRARVFSPDEYYIVLTPDRYTQTVERALFSGGGAIDCEALTLSRLSVRLGASGKALSREGAVMLVARAVAAVRGELCYYRSAAGYYEFAREVSDVFDQISSSALDIRALSAVGPTAVKLNELKMIREKYDELKGESRDAADRLDALIAAIGDSELVKGAHFFAIGYSLGADCTTRLNRRVFEAIAKNAKSFVYFDALPQKHRRACINVYQASDRVQQYKRVAVAIRDYVYNGGRYGDVCVVCPYPRILGRILSEYNIQAYTDETAALCDTPLLAVIEKAYRLRSSSDAETMLSLCKNPFSGCDRRDADELQAEIYSRGITFGALSKVYSGGAARAAARVNKLVAMFDGGFSRAVRDIASYCDFEGVQAKLYPDGTDMVSPVLSLAELLEQYGSGETEAEAAAFFSAARAVEIKSLPRKLDRVTVTSAPTLRLRACPMLFVTDFNEGVLPAAISESGLLDDGELAAISASGSIEPTVREQNKRARAELKAVINNARCVFCSYITGGGAKRSSFLDELAEEQIFSSAAELEATLRGTSDPELIAEYACVPAAARELAARGATAHSASLVEAAGSANTAAPFLDTADIRFKPTLSVSELTHWFTCPYKRFLSDAVGLTERRRTEFGAPDFGVIMHEFMREFFSHEPYDTSYEAVAAIIDRALEKRCIELDDFDRGRLINDAVRFAKKNVSILEAGEYKPSETEYRFSGGRLGKAGTEFVGVIDRIDSCGARTRIIDYKTGSKEFSIKQCVSGLDMQLPLYAAAVGSSVTGFLYVPLGSRYESKQGRATSGRIVQDVNVALEYDRELRSLEASKLFGLRFKKIKKGDYDFNLSYSTQMRREDFDALIRLCTRNASIAADEIAEGYIARSPIAKACYSCLYMGICGEKKTVRGSGTNDDSDEE